MRTIVRLSLVLCLLCSSPAVTAEVEYRLGPATELLDAAFYAGQPEDGSDVAGRMAFFGRASNDGNTVAFWAVNADTLDIAIFLVDIGDPSSWRRLTEDISREPVEPIYWTPDDLAVLARRWRIPLETGELLTLDVHGYGIMGASVTSLSTGNWIYSEAWRQSNVVALPVLSDGKADPSRSPIQVTNFDPPEVWEEAPWWPAPSPDGSSLAWAYSMAALDQGHIYEIADIYALDNLQEILSAPKIPGTDISSLAPTSYLQPHVIPIRVNDEFAGCPTYSEDGNLIFYIEDWNKRYWGDDFWSTVGLADFDIMITNADGSGSPYRLEEPGNQGIATPTPGGNRLIYVNDSPGVMHLYISTLEVSSDVTGDTVGDNDILTITDQQASDASGTVVEIPSGTTIDFPVGEEQEIQIWTPIDPATEPELPDGVDAIPVIREFGPEGTTFSSPITITIAYTDAQVAGLDEANLRVFEYNTVTSKYDLEVTTIVERDLVNNTISFTVTSFSKYGLGASTDTDGDGLTDDVDPDDDNDGLLDGVDSYPLDTDNDGTPNADDWDDDRDGMPDGDDAYPLDTDNDGLNNAEDDDDDGDGILDTIDAYLFDTDNDGEMNDVDDDDDGDGSPDSQELAWGTDPLDPASHVPLPWLPVTLALLGAGVLALARVRSFRHSRG